MGKYMRGRGDSLCSFTIADGSLGARTRARARALQTELSSKNPNHGPNSTQHTFSNHTKREASYMQLRSRIIVHNSAQDCVSTYCIFDKEKLPPQIRCHTQKKPLHISAKEPSLRRKSLRVSTMANSVPLPSRECIMTRNRKQEAILNQEDTEMALSNHGLDSAEINPEQEFCGESQTIDDDDGASSKDKRRRSGQRTENSRDSFIHGNDAPGSTTRSRHSSPNSALPFDPADEAPSSTDIDAFFQGAEQWHRRRFIDRYNFDPMKERPLQGRYEWTRM